VGKTFSRVATGIPFSVIDHLVDEFGPDLQRKLTPKREQPGQLSSQEKEALHCQ